MKRNLSSHAIKAMAIAMAVAMGTTTAISGVVTGTVVNAYATQQGTNGTTKPEKTRNKFIEVPLGDSAYAMFQITEDDSTANGNTTDDGTAKLIKVNATSQISETDLDGTTEIKAYKGTIGGTNTDLVKVTYGESQDQYVAFKMTEVVANSATEAVTVDGEEFSKLAKNLTTIDANSFKNYTFTNGLDLSQATSLTDYQKSLAGVTVQGELKLNPAANLAAEEFKGSNIGTLDLSNHTGTIDAGAFSDSAGTTKTTYGTLKVKDFTSAANSFFNVDVTDTLEFTGNATLGIADSFKPATTGNTINKLVLPTTFNGGADGLFATNTDGKYTITTLDLSNNSNALTDGTFKNTTITDLTHNGKTKMTGSNITKLTVPNSVTAISDSAFEGATIPETISLPKVTNIGANAFKIASPDTVEVTLPAYTNANKDDIANTAFGDASGKTFNIKLTNEAVTPEHATALQDKLTAQNNKVTVTTSKPVEDAPTLKTATIESSNDSEVVLKFSEPIKVENIGNQPAKTDFTVMVDEEKNEVTGVSEIAQTAESDTIKLTLKTPVTKGQNVTVAYTKGTYKILNAAGTELDTFAAESVDNKVGLVEEDFKATTSVGTYTFQKLNESSVALTKFEATKGQKATGNTFVGGTFTQNGKTYTLTQIGTGSAVAGLTDAALKGHTENVTVVEKDAFKGNTNITEINLPKVKEIKSGAFNGASNLSKMDIGSNNTEAVKIEKGALAGINDKANITTNSATESTIKTEVPNADIDVAAPPLADKNDENATIKGNSFYQTTDGLRFRGLDNNSLEYIGSKPYQNPQGDKFTGTPENPWEVTYKNGIVSVKPGVVIDTVTTTTNGKNLTFKVSGTDATLVKVEDAQSYRNNTNTTGELNGGILTADKEYNFTTIGDGEKALADFDAATVLADNLNKVTTIKKNAFKDNTLTKTELNLPEVTTIEESAFQGATGLTTITLPKVKNIGNNAFNGATKLTKVDVKDSTVTFGESVFEGATEAKLETTNQETIDNAIKGGLDSNIQVPEGKQFVKTAIIENNAPTEIKLTLDKAITTAINDKKGFSVTVDGTPLAPEKITGVTGGDSSASSVITITLQDKITQGQEVKVSYDGTNTNGNTILPFENKLVDNQVGKVKPVNVTVDSATANGTTLTINVSGQELKGELNLTGKGFTVTKDKGTAVTVDSASCTTDTITLTLSGSGVEAGDEGIKVSYDGTNEKLVNTSDAPINKIDATFVVNENDETAPTLESAALSGSGTDYAITIVTNEPVKKGSVQNDKFVITKPEGIGSATTFTVNTVDIGADSKTITVEFTTDAEINSTDDKIKIDVQAGCGITDLKGTEVTPKAFENLTLPAVKGYVEYNTTQGTGKVTTINTTTYQNISDIQKLITTELNTIENLHLNGGTLDLTGIDTTKLNIKSILTNGTVDFKVKDSEERAFAEKVKNFSGVKVNNELPNDIINPPTNNGGGSSTGGSAGGGGANIGTVNTDNNNGENNNNNNNNGTVVEDKELSFDVISLPSVTGEAKTFGDVAANYWAKPHIDKLSTAGIINGDQNGNFNPNGQTKRADVTIMLVNLLGLTPETNNKFVDVNPNAYYAPYVGTASSYGIVNGSNGMFNPEGVISRQDTMVMIAQILKGLNLNVNTDNSSLAQFSDANNISSYAQESVAILVNSGIITGNNGKLNPTNPVTRAEMATIMSKLYDVLDSSNK